MIPQTAISITNATTLDAQTANPIDIGHSALWNWNFLQQQDQTRVISLQKYEMVEILKDFSKFNNNWDGYGADKIETPCLENCRTLVNVLKDYSPIKALYPNPNGTITFEFEYSSGKIFLEVGNDEFSGYIALEEFYQPITGRFSHIAADVLSFCVGYLDNRVPLGQSSSQNLIFNYRFPYDAHSTQS